MKNKNRKTLLLTLILLTVSASFVKVSAQSNDDCMMCHEDKSLTAKRNGKTISMFVDAGTMNNSAHKSLKCIQCHKDAAVSDFPHPDILAKVNCSSCHTGFDKSLKTDIHKTLKISNPKTNFTCLTCHSYHSTKQISQIADKNKEFCSKCHNQNVLSTSYHTKSDQNQTCKQCHNKTDFTLQLSKSVHKNLSCANCHGFVANNFELHKKGNKKNSTADCFVCHSEIAEQHKESIHGVSLEEGITDAAKCWSCHGSHDICETCSEKSLTNPNNLTKTCGKCHDDEKFTKKHFFSISSPGKMYSQSVHGKLVKHGSTKAPSCSSCHGIHNIKNRVQDNSTISSINVAETCAKCHKQIAEEYKKSIHWMAVKKGVRESPTCNDCHNEHGIEAINAGDDVAMKKKIQDNTCLICHESILLSQRYNIEEGNISRYKDSYHGLAVTCGDDKAAMCVDCHGVHNILPAYHEDSKINEKNLTNTCKKCHPEATDVFAKSYSHVSKDSESAKFIEDIVKSIYMWLIIIVIGGMMIHNILIFIHDIKEKRKHHNNQIKIPRFTTNELIQHTFLLSSFIMLSVSGFLLKFPGTWYADLLQTIGMHEETRKIVHRVSAVVMIVLSVYHVGYLLFTKRGRSVLNGLFPRLSDLKTAGQNIMYYLRLSKKHPEFDNYNYIEKAEYWALIWGTIVMVLTGFILWFPTIVGNWAPVWVIKVSEIVHFYEAVLATLAIVVWHWFFVVFRPKEYPISFTSVDGQMSIEHYKEEHKMRFKQVIIEWAEIKSGKKSADKISYFTKFFVSALEKKNVNVEQLFRSEIEKDPGLKEEIDKNNIQL